VVDWSVYTGSAERGASTLRQRWATSRWTVVFSVKEHQQLATEDCRHSTTRCQRTANTHIDSANNNTTIH